MSDDKRIIEDLIPVEAINEVAQRLGYELPESTRVFRLRRHNGNSHDHPNRLEQAVVRGFHVHLATERYQLAGYEEDGYAETTNSYRDLAGAIHSMIAIANFSPPRQGSFPI